MKNTPLQIYKRAYDYQYKENKTEEASSLYRELIRNFPDSDVSFYSSIQLSKIQSNNISMDTSHKKSARLWPVVILLIINFILTAGIVFGFLLYYQAEKKREETTIKIMQALGKLYAGKDNDALSILEGLKLSSREDVTPFLMSAYIHVKNHNFRRAKMELEAYYSLYPADLFVKAEIDKIEKEEEAYIESMEKARLVETAPPPEEEKSEIKLKSAPKYREPEPPKKIIKKDEIIYF